MSTFVGRMPKERAKVAAKSASPDEKSVTPNSDQAEQKDEKTKAELIEEAESLGIKVTPKMSKPQIQKLIDEAPVM